MDSINDLDERMRSMPPEWRDRWCEPGEFGCACMGCANASGGLIRAGYTKADWQAWMKRVTGAGQSSQVRE